jgi:hypothetical protein
MMYLYQSFAIARACKFVWGLLLTLLLPGHALGFASYQRYIIPVPLELPHEYDVEGYPGPAFLGIPNL